jgi:hypothetical protein
MPLNRRCSASTEALILSTRLLSSGSRTFAASASSEQAERVQRLPQVVSRGGEEFASCRDWLPGRLRERGRPRRSGPGARRSGRRFRSGSRAIE